MNLRPCQAPAGPAARIVWRTTLWCALFVGAGLALGVGAAFADPTDEGPAAEEEDLYQELLKGTSPGEWRGVLNRILQEKDATWIGRVLGGLLRDSVKDAEQADKAAYIAAYLADRPENDKVLLGAAIVRRVHGDEAFLAAMLSHITKGEGGWLRLLAHARELLAGEDVLTRRAALFLLSHETGEQGADEREAVRRDLLARLAADLPSLAGANGVRAALVREYLEAFERLLGYRFSSVDEAVKTLEELKGLDFAQLSVALSKRKNRPDAPDRKKLIDFGKRLIDDAVASGDPEAVEEFLDPSRTPYVELRRYAIQKAGQMAPEPNAKWGRIFRQVLDGEDDAEVLRDALTRLERIGFAEAAEVAPRLSASLATRLRSRGSGAADSRDALADRVRLAKLVGSLKVRSKEFDALVADGDRLEGEVLAELVRALGGMTGVSVDEILVHYRRSDEDPGRGSLVRVAAVDALGRSGFRAGNGQTEWAAAVLREILTGEGEGGLGRSDDDVIRRHAIRSLGIHSGAETAEVLRRIGAGEHDQEASVAIVVMRKAGAADAHAVQALGAIAQDAALSPERRVETLKGLATLVSAEEGPRELACEAARTVLGENAPDEVRLEAAAACAVLADPLALEAMLTWWSEDKNDDRRSALRTLLVAVASADAANDALVASTLVGVAESGDPKDLDFADKLATEVVEIAGRAPLKVARARILFAFAGREDRDPAARRQHLIVALPLLRDVVGAAGVAVSPVVRTLLVRVLRLHGDLAEEPAAQKDLYLEALRRATASADPATIQLGLEIADLLEAEPLGALLDPAEVGRIADDRKALQAKLGG